MPSSAVVAPWPTGCTLTARPCRLAHTTVAATSSASCTVTTASGRWGTARFQPGLTDSQAGSSAVRTCPGRTASSSASAACRRSVAGASPGGSDGFLGSDSVIVMGLLPLRASWSPSSATGGTEAERPCGALAVRRTPFVAHVQVVSGYPHAMARDTFTVLGEVSASLDGRPVVVSARRTRSVLALLLSSPRQVVSADRLVTEVWGDDMSLDSGRASLQVLVSRLRSAMEPGRTRSEPPRLLVSSGNGYALMTEPGAIDAERFAALVVRAEELLAAGRADEGLAACQEALALWRGAPYPDVDGETVAAEVARLEGLRQRLVELHAAAQIDVGRPGLVAVELEPFVAAHPFRERAWELLALALYRSGRQADALDAVRRARTALLEELGVDPSPALRELETALLEQDPALLVGAGARADVTTGPRRPAVDVRAADPAREGIGEGRRGTGRARRHPASARRPGRPARGRAPRRRRGRHRRGGHREDPAGDRAGGRRRDPGARRAVGSLPRGGRVPGVLAVDPGRAEARRPVTRTTGGVAALRRPRGHRARRRVGGVADLRRGRADDPGGGARGAAPAGAGGPALGRHRLTPAAGPRRRAVAGRPRPGPGDGPDARDRAARDCRLASPRWRERGRRGCTSTGSTRPRCGHWRRRSPPARWARTWPRCWPSGPTATRSSSSSSSGCSPASTAWTRTRHAASPFRTGSPTCSACAWPGCARTCTPCSRWRRSAAASSGSTCWRRSPG